MLGLVPLWKDTADILLAPSLFLMCPPERGIVCTQQDTSLDTRKRILTRVWTCCTLVVDFLPPELWENKYLLFKAPSLWYPFLFLWQPKLNNILCACVLSYFSCVWFLAILWTVAYQTPLSTGFSRKEYWCGLPWIKPASLMSPALVGRFFITSTTRAAWIIYYSDC